MVPVRVEHGSRTKLGTSGPTGNCQAAQRQAGSQQENLQIMVFLDLSSGTTHTAWLPGLFLDFPVKDVSSRKSR